MHNLIGTVELGIGNESLGRSESINFAPASVRTFVPTRTWYFPGHGTAGEQMSGLLVFFTVGGVGEFFGFM